MSKNYDKSMPILMRLVEYSIKCIKNGWELHEKLYVCVYIWSNSWKRLLSKLKRIVAAQIMWLIVYMRNTCH